MFRRYVVLVVAATLALDLAACSNSKGFPGPDFSPTADIEATKTLTFVPVTLTVQKGRTVYWANNSGIDHNITFENGAPFSRSLNDGAQVQRTFTFAGTFKFYCMIHGKSMHGTIVVF